MFFHVDLVDLPVIHQNSGDVSRALTAGADPSLQQVTSVGDADAAAPNEELLLDRRRLFRLRSMLSRWLDCIDRSTAASSGTLAWAPRNPCNLTSMTGSPIQNPLLVDLMAAMAVEGHGDSTLRELLKLWVGYFGLSGSLNKNDANAKLRDAKFFFRNLSDEGSISLKNGVEAKNRRLFRILFRFDFDPGSFFDAFPENVALSDAFHAFFSSGHAAASRRPPALALLLSTGSHYAKGIVMNDSHIRIKRLLLSPPSAALSNSERDNVTAADVVFSEAVAPLEDYLIWRFLRLRVQRDSQTKTPFTLQRDDKKIQRGWGSRNSSSDGGGGAFVSQQLVQLLPQPRVAFIFLQTMECESMAEAKLPGFRDMAPHCSSIVSILRQINHAITSNFFAQEEEEPSGSAENDYHWGQQHLHRLSALRLLSSSERSELLSRTMVVPPLECHLGHFRFDSSKRFCTKDGVHLRTKFIRIKLEMVLQALLRLF
jgi:hypothetical protein